MLVRLLRARRHLFLSLPLALLQPQILLLAFLHAHRLFKYPIIQIKQIILRRRTRIHHPRQSPGVRVVLRLRGHAQRILTLPDRPALLPSADGVQAVSCRPRQLQQSDLVFLRHQHLPDARLLLLILAVDVVGKRRRGVAAALEHPVGQQVVVAELHLRALRLHVAPSRVIESLRVLRRVAQRQILLSRKDRARHLRPILQKHNPYTHCSCSYSVT